MSDQGLGMVVQSRQRGEALQLSLPVTGLVGASETVASNAVRAQGYNAVVGMLLSDVSFSVEIQGASAIRKAGRQVAGEWSTLDTVASVASGTRQRVTLDHEVRADYIRIRLVNGATKQEFFQHGVRLIPIFSFKRVELVSGDATVEVTGPGGGTGSGSSNSLLPVPVGGAPGDDITVQDDTAVGVGATVALPTVPSGTRRMTVQVVDGDDATRIRVRDVSGAAGQGLLLSLLSSTSFGGGDGALEDLEVEHVAGAAADVAVLFERD